MRAPRHSFKLPVVLSLVCGSLVLAACGAAATQAPAATEAPTVIELSALKEMSVTELTRIAKQLYAEGISPPCGGVHGWAPSAVREMLSGIAPGRLTGGEPKARRAHRNRFVGLVQSDALAHIEERGLRTITPVSYNLT